ncbi:MAG: AMP-binding protein, partial [Actinomycetota bacterium]|nr:AMP-binding protein [Actinomycetota bacterium]
MTQSRTQHDAPSPSAGQGRPETVGALFIDRVTRSAAAEAFRIPTPDGAWESVSWTAVGERVTRLAAGLLALGIEPGERVAIMSGTRYEWIVADFAVMCAGAATTTVYPTTIAEDVAFILCDSDSRVVIAEDPAQLAKLRERRAELPNVRTVVLITGDAGAEDGWVISLDELARRGADLLAATPDAVAARSAATGPDSLATLIYTSGTTGRPKGVRLSHAAWAYQASALVDLDILGAGDLQYLWLPLAHAFGKVLLTAQLAIGFPTAVDGRVDRIVENLAVIRPSFMGAVPRIFEKAHGRIATTVEAKGGPRARLFAWAVGVGRRVGDARLAGRPVPTL